VSLFDPVTAAEQLGWQRRAVTVLGGYLDVAIHEGLPALRWTIGDAGSTLVGHCRTRPEWQTWQALLQLPDVQPEIAHHGFARLRASGRVAAPNGLTVQVILIADIDLDREHLGDPLQNGDLPRDAA
jgi:hypothetical protein